MYHIRALTASATFAAHLADDIRGNFGSRPLADVVEYAGLSTRQQHSLLTIMLLPVQYLFSYNTTLDDTSLSCYATSKCNLCPKCVCASRLHLYEVLMHFRR
jgi:hypothetical protein